MSCGVTGMADYLWLSCCFRPNQVWQRSLQVCLEIWKCQPIGKCKISPHGRVVLLYSLRLSNHLRGHCSVTLGCVPQRVDSVSAFLLQLQGGCICFCNPLKSTNTLNARIIFSPQIQIFKDFKAPWDPRLNGQISCMQLYYQVWGISAIFFWGILNSQKAFKKSSIGCFPRFISPFSTGC